MFLLSSFFFFYFAGVGVYIVFLPKILHDIGYSSYDIGIIFACVPLMRFLTPFLFLKLFQLSLKVYKIALLVSLLSTITFFFSINSFAFLLINMSVFGISSGLIMPYIDTIALEKLGKNYGKSRLWGSLGFMATGLILAKLYNGYETGLWFYVFIGSMLFIFGYLISFSANSFNLKQDMPSKAFSLLKEWRFWITIFLIQVSFGFFYSFFTIYENSHGISLELVSYLWSLSIVCEVAMFAFQERLLYIKLSYLIKFAVLVTFLRWFLLFLFPSSLAVATLTQSFHAVTFALFHTATITYLYRTYKQKKLAMQFYQGISYGLGGFTGSLMGGYFYGEYLFLIASLIALLALLFAPDSSI